ncbi:hypothetical protein M8J75_006853 [Diaphorina citri]|nr:hypothetical protein M8J75_006853 [Diaphorina citri]
MPRNSHTQKSHLKTKYPPIVNCNTSAFLTSLWKVFPKKSTQVESVIWAIRNIVHKEKRKEVRNLECGGERTKEQNEENEEEDEGGGGAEEE